MKKMNKNKKKEIVNWLTEEFKNSKIYLLVNFSGLSVLEMQNLRQLIKENNGDIKVIKSSLIERAFKNLSKDEAVNYLGGPIFVVWTKDGDEIEIIKKLYAFGKRVGKIAVKGGVINNKISDAEFFEKLSKLTSIKEIQSKLIYVIKFPVIKITNLIRSPGVRIVNILNQISQK